MIRQNFLAHSAALRGENTSKPPFDIDLFFISLHDIRKEMKIFLNNPFPPSDQQLRAHLKHFANEPSFNPPLPLECSQLSEGQKNQIITTETLAQNVSEYLQVYGLGTLLFTIKNLSAAIKQETEEAARRAKEPLERQLPS